MTSGFHIPDVRPGSAATVAAYSERHEISRQDFCACVAANAAVVRGEAGDRWVPLADNALDFAIAFFALLGAGKTVVLPPSGDVLAVEDDALQIDAVLSAEPQPALGLRTHVLLGESRSEAYKEECLAIPGDGDIELFTSGSTGSPKCIRKKFRQFAEEAQLLGKTFDALAGDASVIATVPHHHIYGLLFRIIWPLVSRRPFHAEQTLTPHSRNEEGTVLVSSPAFMKRLLDPVELEKNHLKVIFSSGGALAPELARSVAEAAACPLVEVYGSTETGGIAWRRWPDGSGHWQFFDGLSHELEALDGASGDEQFRLHVRSAATDHQWIDTGDVIRLDGDGFELLGRADGILKIEDKRVSLAAIEACLEQHPDILEARVIVLDGRRRELAAVVHLAEPSTTTATRQVDTSQVDTPAGRRSLAAHFRKHLASRFDKVATPKRWRFVSTMPVNDMGKITQDVLVGLFRNSEGAA